MKLKIKIIIITDGNEKQGLGHIYQSKTLANYLRDYSSNLDISFVTKSDEEIASLIQAEAFDVKIFNDDTQIFEYLININPNIVIFDKIDVSFELAKKIKEQIQCKLVIFTNLSKANQIADVCILADVEIDFENIKSELENGQINFFGPKYWILRPEFQILRDKKPTFKSINKILLMFGGADPCNYSTLVTKELLKLIDKDVKISLIIGSAYKHEQTLNNILKGDNLNKVNIYRNVNNVSQHMIESDLVIASPGLSFFEALVLGVPVIGFHQDNLQKESYSKIFKTYGVDDIVKLSDLLNSNQFIFPHDEFIKKMEIGKGIEEIIEQILK